MDYAKIKDEEIVEIVRAKDKNAYAEIIKRYEAKLTRYTNNLIRDENKASDIVQETFIKAYVNLNGFNVNKKFSSWIYRIAHNLTINIFNKYKKQIPLNEKIDFDSGINLEDEMIKKELKTYVKDCLSQIPIIYAEALSLYFLEEKSYEEISDILQIPIGTVGTRINRAKIYIKKICKRKIQN